MIDKIKNYIAEVEKFSASTQEEVENFRIKFRGSASIPVKGNTLNAKSHKEAKSLKTGDFVTIFYIENLIINNQKSQEFKTISIKII